MSAATHAGATSAAETRGQRPCVSTGIERKYPRRAGDTDRTAPSEVGTVYNALLEQTKVEKPGDPVVAALDPVPISSGSEFADVTCGALRTVVQQLISAHDG